MGVKRLLPGPPALCSARDRRRCVRRPHRLGVKLLLPGLQGDRSSGGTKPATLETGLVIQVPLFIDNGEKVKIDTRSGEYLSRA